MNILGVFNLERRGDDLMNFFPNGEEEINLLKFLARYQYLRIEDAKYFFKSKKYYRTRISSLIKKHYLCKNKSNITLGDAGTEYAKIKGFEYNKINWNTKYKLRLLNVSSIAAFYYYNDIVDFFPSSEVKDAKSFTAKSRKYIGILSIDRFKYLTYYISKEHDQNYIASILWDIQKEKNYRNIIVFVDDIRNINLDDFVFGKHEVLIVENNDSDKLFLQYYNRMHWEWVIEKYYGRKTVLSEYSFCDFTNHKDKFVSFFYFLDTEKINRIKYFIRENKEKKADILCSKELRKKLEPILPNQNYLEIDLDKYTKKEKINYV